MPTKTKCRSCSLDKRLTIQRTKHALIKADLDFVCLVCDKKPKWYSHINDELSGDALECKSCHNYILYIFPEPDKKYKKWKDEIYIPVHSGEIVVIRNYEDNTTYISINDKEVTTLKKLISFNSFNELINKIKIITVFS